MSNYKCYVFDFFYYLLFAYLIYDIASLWNYFSYCHHPLHIWLIITFGFYITKRVFVFLMNSIDNPSYFKYILGIYLIVVYPNFVYWTVQGTFWIVDDSQNTQCKDKISVFWLIYLCMALSYLIIVIILAYTLHEIFHYYRILRIRRRIENILNNIDLLLASSALNNPLFNENEENEFGLSEDEIKHLKTITLKKESLLEDDLQNCSICLEDLRENDEAIFLPGCNHSFHSICILSWLQKKPFCPNCKGNIRLQLNDLRDVPKEEIV